MVKKYDLFLFSDEVISLNLFITGSPYISAFTWKVSKPMLFALDSVS